MKTIKNEELAIRALTDRFSKAFNSGDVDAIMEHYVPDESFIIFDLVPREEYQGADTYRKDWLDMFSHFKGKPHITIIDLNIIVDGDVGFGYSFQHVTGTDNKGNSVARTVRVTNGYRKINGNWLIALEHVSVPVDLTTGKAVFFAKP